MWQCVGAGVFVAAAGDIIVNGQPKQQATWARKVGYVEQMVSSEGAGRMGGLLNCPPSRQCLVGCCFSCDSNTCHTVTVLQDIHSANTTVEEALWFSGRLRLPPSVTDAQVRACVCERRVWQRRVLPNMLYCMLHCVFGCPPPHPTPCPNVASSSLPY